MMKYPLSRFRCALLEIYCYFLGHNWKSSWHRNEVAIAWQLTSKQSAISHEDLPYALRHRGNPYWEYSAGWRYKCRRCRLSIRNDSFDPWYKVYYWAIKCSIRSFVSAIRFAREEDGTKSKLWILPHAFLSATTQFFAHMVDQPHWPVFLLDVSLDWEGKIMDKVFND